MRRGDGASEIENKLGLKLANMSVQWRQQFKLTHSLEGVVITAVEPQSAAANRGLTPGDIVLEIASQKLSSPDEMRAKLGTVQKEHKRTALLRVSIAAGDQRYVVLPLP